MVKKEQINKRLEDALLIELLKHSTHSSAFLVKCHTKVDVDKLMTLANLHGVIPQLYKAIQTAETDVNDDLKEYLRKQHRNILQSNLLLTANLLTITKALEENGFKYLSIKGPTLSQELYADISMRQFSDIDLFVEEKNMFAISTLLTTIGYEPVLPLSLLQRKKFLELDNDFSFRHKKNNALLELHWKLFPLRHKMPLDFRELYSTSKTLRLQNRDIITLSVEDNLLYLSLHASKHIFERYEWVYDLHTLIKNNPDLDLFKIYLKAKKEAIDVPFLLGIFMSQTLFETEIPENFQALKTDHIQSLIAKTLSYYKEGFVYWDESDKKRARFLFLSKLFENKELKILWLFKSLFKTTPVDVITFNLPDQLSFLYPLLRPFRLVYKHFLTKKTTHA